MSDFNLKPCPFCGGKPDFDQDDSGYIWIYCQKCGVSTDTRMHGHEDARISLSEDWNQRDKAALQQSLAELKAEVAQEIAMMKVVGEDGVADVTKAIKKLKTERDQLAAHVERINRVLDDKGETIEFEYCPDQFQIDNEKLESVLSENPQTSLAERDAEIAIQSEQALFKSLYYAPSSPVKPEKATEISDWYSKFKQAQSAKDGE